MPHRLLHHSGTRKYLNAVERQTVLSHALVLGNDTGLFCWILIETGCRISEALALTQRNIDMANAAIIIECLKKRRRGVFRSVPVSEALIGALYRRFHSASPDIQSDRDTPLWPWCRMTAYRHVCSLMRDAGVRGPHASPKGLRHAFGVAAVTAGIPLNLVQRWLGHADMRTTSIYANVAGPEERRIASRLWLHAPVGLEHGPTMAGLSTVPGLLLTPSSGIASGMPSADVQDRACLACRLPHDTGRLSAGGQHGGVTHAHKIPALTGRE